MPRFVVIFGADVSSAICFGEIRSLLTNGGFDANAMIPSKEWEVLENPCLVLDFSSAEAGHAILSSSVTAKAYLELFACGNSLDEAVSELESTASSVRSDLWDARNSWRIQVESLGHRHTTNAQRAGVRMRCAPFLPFQGAVDLSDEAHVTISVLLKFESPHFAGGVPAPSKPHPSPAVEDGVLFGLPADRLRGVFIGTSHGTRRPLHIELALPRRAYLGPTSLEPMLALVMCNMAAVRKGSLVADPFVGTASILIAAARLGATVTLGIELDFRVVCMGKLGRTIASNFEQYGLPYPELLRADMADIAFRDGVAGIFDAFVTDPPYGVRAGVRQSDEAVHATTAAVAGQRAGRRSRLDRNSSAGGERDPPLVDAPLASDPPDSSSGTATPATPAETSLRRSFPRMRNLEGEGVLLSLLDLAARGLRLGGRLTYLYPATVGYSPAMLPHHPCLELAQDCAGEALTPFLSRRIITMIKVRPYDFSQALMYRSAGEAAARASGTLDASLRTRLGEAYDMWLASRRKALPQIIDQLKRNKTATTVTKSDVGLDSAGGAATNEASAPQQDAPATVIDSTEEGSDIPVSRGQLKKDAKRLIRQLKREQRLNAAAGEADLHSVDVSELSTSERRGTADLEHFAEAVGWKRSRDQKGVSTESELSPSVPVPPQSRRARLRQATATRVALMTSGVKPMQIGQVPFSRASALKEHIPSSGAAPLAPTSDTRCLVGAASASELPLSLSCAAGSESQHSVT